MTVKTIILLGLAILLLLPTLASSDCVDLGRSTGWYIREEHKVIFYAGTRPLASLDIPGCTINSSSDIRLIKNYVCDEDNIIVDGEKCSIMTVSSASTVAF